MRILQAIIAPVNITQEEIDALIADEFGNSAVNAMKSAQKSVGGESQKWILFDDGDLVDGSLDVRPLSARHDVVVFSGEPKDPESAAAKAATPIAENFASFVGSPEDKFRSAFYEQMWAFMDLASATMSLEGDAKTRLKTLLPYWKKINDFLKESVESLGDAAVKMQAPGLVDSAIQQIRAIRPQIIADIQRIMAGEPIDTDALKNSDGNFGITTGEDDMAEIDYDRLATTVAGAVIAAQKQADAEKEATEAAAEKEAKFVEAVATKAAEMVGEPLKVLTGQVEALKPKEDGEAAKEKELEAQKAAVRAEIDEAKARLDKLENSTASRPSSPEDPSMDAAAKAAHEEMLKEHPMMNLRPIPKDDTD